MSSLTESESVQSEKNDSSNDSEGNRQVQARWRCPDMPYPRQLTPQIHHLLYLRWGFILCVPRMFLMAVPASMGNHILIHLPASRKNVRKPMKRRKRMGCKYFPSIGCHFVVCSPFVLRFFIAFVFDKSCFMFLCIRCCLRLLLYY